ncbi:hypothetical protein Tco_0923606 [Tanacetum coccineum]|uniref:Uncharacterized protein n=1 Tax=Tanacetum coccineum TaxID=301880 RepID=A0ABQ5D2W5_9ASTR
MYYKKNVDFVELIWEDIMYQIDNRQTTAVRRSSMPYPRFTKAIIRHFISKDKTISIRNNLFMHSIKDDSILGVLKFISMYEENQVYGKPKPGVMLSKEIMETTTYKTYLAFATVKAIPKKVRKRTKAHITPMKESSLTSDDNIISKDPNAALELSKLMSKTKAEEEEVARVVHETHERIVTKKPTVRIRQTGVVFRDTPTISKKKSLDQSQELKGVQVMSEEEHFAADIKKAIKASKLAIGPQQTTCSSEGVGLKLEVLDEPTVGTGAHDDSKESWGNDSDTEKSNEEEVQWIYSYDDKEDDHDDDQSIDLAKTDDEGNKHDNDETQRYEYVHEDEYIHTNDDERTESDNEDQAMDDAKKNDEDKAEEEKSIDQEPIQDEHLNMR